MKLYSVFNSIRPSEIDRADGNDIKQNNSTKTKKTILKMAERLDKILGVLGYQLTITKID